jgi:SAM-dependent methyltransferase
MKKDFTFIARYADLFASQTGVEPNIHVDDFIFRFLLDNPSFPSTEAAVRYYFYDGMNSANKLKELLVDLNYDINDITLLEFASGYGCVSRHLKKYFGPRLTACDIHKQAVIFINSVLGIDAILSVKNPDDFVTNRRYDVVFALSFFSHMPRKTWSSWLKSLFEILNPNGVLIFTTHGDLCRKFFGNPVIPEDGFLFFPFSEQKDLDPQEYGNTIVTRGFVEKCVDEVLHRNCIYLRGFWWGNQDLYVVKND